MDSLYKLDVLYILRKAIINKHYGSNMSFDEKSVYDAVVLDLYKTLDVSVDDDFLFETYFKDYFNDWYLNKGKNEDLNKIDQLLIFRGLLHFKGQTVSLMEFYDYTFGKYFKDRFDLCCESDRMQLLEMLNGCLGEARVARVDSNSFVSRELTLSSNELDWFRLVPCEQEKISLCDEMLVRVSTNFNPLLFITGLEPSEVKKFEVRDGNRFTFISISDLHLGGCLVDNHGNISKENEIILKERLEYFVTFKNKIIEDLRKNNIKIDGIIFVGDNFNAVSRIFDSSYDKDKLKNNLELSRGKILKIIKDFNQFNGGCLQFSSDMGLIGFIAGNHDNSLGRDLFLDAMKVFGENVTFLGDGSGRIKVNDEYILFSHPSSYDWGLPIFDDFFKIRRNFEHDIFHFEEYFDLCKRKYTFLERLNLSYILGNTPQDRLMSLASLVNDDLMKNNPKLYKFYEPFITRGDDGSLSCFEEVMRITTDNSDPNITHLVKRPQVKYGFTVGRFIDYSKKHSNIKQMLDERHICLVGDGLDPTLSIIGHFHTRLSDGKKVSYAKGDSDSDGLVPVVIEESSSHHREDRSTFSATVCCLDIKDGVIDRIELEPAVYEVKRDGICQATRISTTVSSVYVRKKTL